ncbi:hypothetical protein DL96DRAFT_1817288 [Flagelloscypha sp. PMI_526]|nr:hypothetical protein DL96DRAFT_1817288 [Flagelloscypha sp. PMI_526]
MSMHRLIQQLNALLSSSGSLQPKEQPKEPVELPEDIIRLIFAWASCMMTRADLLPLLLVSRSTHDAISWIYYRSILLRARQVDSFIWSMKYRGRRYYRPRVKALAFIGDRLGWAQLRNMEDLIHSTFKSLESFHYSCNFHPSLGSAIQLGPSGNKEIRLEHLKTVSIDWRFLKSQERPLVGVTHLHLHLEKCDQPVEEVADALLGMSSLSHILLNFEFRDHIARKDSTRLFLDFLHSAEMNQVKFILVLTRHAPEMEKEEDYPKATYPKLVLDRTGTAGEFGCWNILETHWRKDFWGEAEKVLREREAET